MKYYLSTAAVLILGLSPLMAHDTHGKEELSTGETKKITGEVVDLACYVDHKAAGEKHTDCAKNVSRTDYPLG